MKIMCAGCWRAGCQPRGTTCLTATSGEAAWEMAMNDPPGRITAICDVYDALIMDRPYRAALPEEEVLRIMTPEKGRSFDPRLFDIFMDVLPSFRRIGIELS